MNPLPPKPSSPVAARIAGIRASIRCFVFSLVGLIPLVGIPFSVAAIVQTRRVAKRATGGWNPADRYLGAARRIGPLGFLSTTVFLVLACMVVPALWRDVTSCGGGG